MVPSRSTTPSASTSRPGAAGPDTLTTQEEVLSARALGKSGTVGRDASDVAPAGTVSAGTPARGERRRTRNNSGSIPRLWKFSDHATDGEDDPPPPYPGAGTADAPARGTVAPRSLRRISGRISGGFGWAPVLSQPHPTSGFFDASDEFVAARFPSHGAAPIAGVASTANRTVIPSRRARSSAEGVMSSPRAMTMGPRPHAITSASRISRGARRSAMSSPTTRGAVGALRAPSARRREDGG